VVFIFSKSEGGFYVSIIPGLVMCIGSIAPTLDALVNEKTASNYTALGLPTIVGVAVVFLAQIAALFHCAALFVGTNSDMHMNGGKYHDLSLSLDDPQANEEMDNDTEAQLTQ